MPTNHDYWNENVHTVYTDVIEIFEGDDNHNPVVHQDEEGHNLPVKYIRLNNSGNNLNMYVDGEEHLFTPAVFEFNEPDRNSINDETGTLSIGGVTSEYVENLEEVFNESKIIVRIGLVMYDKAKASPVTHLEDYWICKMLDYEASSISINSANAQIQIGFKSGSMQLSFFASKKRYSNTEFPCIFG